MFSFFYKKQSSNIEWKDTRDGLDAAYTHAVETYNSEWRFPLTTSMLGVPFNFTDFITISYQDRTIQVTELKEIFSKYATDTNDQNTINACVLYLQIYGASWGGPELSLNSFSNYFLTALREENVHAFRTIIGKAFGIKFIEDPCILRRRDKRHYKIIFDEGFRLKEDKNTPLIRKKEYCQPITYSFGISTSFVVPPKRYGRKESSGYFEIEFKKGHRALLVDIDQSPRNKDRHQNLKEVNSIEPILSENIREFVLEKSCCQSSLNFFIESNRKIKNSKFNPEISTVSNLNNIAKIK